MADSGVPAWHAAEYGSARRVKAVLGLDNPRVLVLGGRISAGQIALEFCGSGCETWIVPRSKLRFSRTTAWPRGLQDAYFRVEEELAANWGWDRKGSTFAHMDGARVRDLLRSGKIHLAGPLVRMGSGEAWMGDGRRVQCDAVILATGYRPVLAPLEAPADLRAGMVAAPGIYCLGLDRLTNFRSRFLRGIRRDAEHLAHHLRALHRLNSTP